MSENDLFDVIIIGGGPGGLSAGLYCMRAALDTILFERLAPGGQVAISKDVENYPGIEDITGFDLSERMLKHAKSYGLKVFQQEVEVIEPGEDVHTVRISDGTQIGAHALIMAMGGSARKLDIPGESEFLGRGVSYCATCDGFFFRDKTVVVVGGGDTAIEEALYLSRITTKVYLIHRRDSFRASRLLQNRVFADPKIEIIWNTVVKEIQGDSQGVQSLSLENIESGKLWELPTEGIFIFVGYSPNNGIVPPLVRMNEKGYVLTDEKCETNIPGIFAIGDLRQKYANQIVIAAADGCTAALAAARHVESVKFNEERRTSSPAQLHI